MQVFHSGDDSESESSEPILSPYLTGLSALTALCLESNSALGASFDSLGLSLTHLSSLAVLRFRDNHECSEAQASTLFSQLAQLTWIKVHTLVFVSGLLYLRCQLSAVCPEWIAGFCASFLCADVCSESHRLSRVSLFSVPAFVHLEQ
jgi:hypothetical protein